MATFGITATPKFLLGEVVYKVGFGYSGPGSVKAVFAGWDGKPRYVVAHTIEKGKGEFYHIYMEDQLIKPGDYDELPR